MSRATGATNTGGAKGGVLLIGGSGFIGTRLARQALASARYDFVRVADLRPPDPALGQVEYHRHDVRRPLPDSLGEGVSTIYNLAAVHRTPGHPAHAYYETNVNGAVNSVELARRTDIRNLVFTSSISVYGPKESRLDEHSPLVPVSDYGRSKAMAEAIHRAWQEASPDRSLVIVRPGVVFGPGEDGNFTALARALRRGYFFYPGRTDTVKSSIYVGELVRALDFAVARAAPITCFNATYPEPSSMKAIVQAFAGVAGWPAKRPTVPLQALLGAALPFELLNGMGLDTRIHRERVMKLVLSTRIAPDWLIANGYRFETDLESGLARWRDESDGAFV